MVIEAPSSKGRFFVAVEPLPKGGQALDMPQTIDECTIESIAGHYESEEIAFGVVYRWHPGSLRMECGCSKVLTLTHSLSTCSEVGADHAPVVQEELAGLCSEDEVRHPWRYAGAREELGLPF